MYYSLFLIFIFIKIVLLTPICVDDNNNPVDWFIVYKLPKIKHTHNFINNGLAYIYLTSENQNWVLSSKSINDTTCLLLNTIKPLYENPNDQFYVFYNDQPPNGKSEPEKGHNKGIIFGNSSGGVWIIHSVPHFLNFPSPYNYPKTGSEYGQSIICISMDLFNLNNVGLQLQYNEPQIYSYKILNDLQSSLNNLNNAARGSTIKKAPWNRKCEIHSRKGQRFISYAKSMKFGKDLYVDWLAPDLESDLYVETWKNGAGDLPSDCSKKFQVFNVRTVVLNTANITFNSTHDHSKWAVSTPKSNKNFVCIGDINRMEHQKTRGGGTVCLENNNLAAFYQKSVLRICVLIGLVAGWLWTSILGHFNFSLKITIFIVAKVFWILIVAIFRCSWSYRFFRDFNTGFAQSWNVRNFSHCLFVINNFSGSESTFYCRKIANFV